MRLAIAILLLAVSMPVLAAEPRVAVQTKDAQAILNYLLTRPYEEVYQLIPGLVNLKSVVEPEAKPEKVAKKPPKKGKKAKKVKEPKK